MGKMHTVAATTAVILSFFCAGNAVDGRSMSGRAVSVQYLTSQTSWSNTYCRSGGTWCGSIDLFTINAGKVTRTDTLFSRSRGYCYSPAFDLCGNKIAFYRLAAGPGSNGACASVNGGKNTISIMDISGNNLVNLCDVGTEPLMYADGTGGLDWPAGEWIYYLKTVGSANNEVWKVNATTKATSLVCSFNVGGSGGYFRRFSLDLAADRMGCQVLGGSWFTNDVQAFPNGCSIPTRTGNCNAAISASGNYKCSFEGDHTRLVLSLFRGASGVTAPSGNLDAYRINTVFQPTTTDQFGEDVEGLGWACNSDKWVLQQVGWYGHAEAVSAGSEQVATNWVDMVAIRISNNGKTPLEPCDVAGKPDCCGGCGAEYYCNEFGDLWVDGGPSNAGKYEDASGIWHSVPGWTGSCSATQVAYTAAEGSRLRTPGAYVDKGGSIHLSSFGSGNGTARITNMQGESVYQTAMAGSGVVRGPALKPGVYLVSQRSGATCVTTRVTVSR